MRVVVTGAAGFIGSHLCEALLNEGHEVTGCDAFIPYYPREVKESNLSPLRGRSGFSFLEMDLREADLDPLLVDAEAVVHEAAMPGLVQSWANFSLYMTCNILGTQRLIEAALRSGVRRYVHVSTSSVYGTEATGDERQPLQPVSPYGVTKLAAEQLVRAYCEGTDELSIVVLRYFSVYGPRQRPDMAYHRFIQALANNEEILVFGDGEQSRSSTYISDCVKGTVDALAKGRDGEVYNIGGGELITVLEVIEMIAQALGVQPRIRFTESRQGDQRHTRADTSKAFDDFGYIPQVEPPEGIARQIEWQLGKQP